MFTFKGQPVEPLSTAAWYEALKRAGIETFRWHDLRHTWASAAMVQRYAHLAADPLAPWAERLARQRADRGTNPSEQT